MIALSTWSSITPDLVDRQFQVAFEQPFQNLLMLIFLWAMVACYNIAHGSSGRVFLFTPTLDCFSVYYALLTV
jgi:hypothetical protein